MFNSFYNNVVLVVHNIKKEKIRRGEKRFSLKISSTFDLIPRLHNCHPILEQPRILVHIICNPVNMLTEEMESKNYYSFCCIWKCSPSHVNT